MAVTVPTTAACAPGSEDWRSATRSAAALLVDLGTAGDDYPDACVANLEKNGPYIVLAPGVALVHAQISTGTREGVAVLRLDEGVEFGHPANDPVDLLLAFSSGGDHMAMIQSLGIALSGGLASRLRQADDVAAMDRCLQEVVRHD